MIETVDWDWWDSRHQQKQARLTRRWRWRVLGILPRRRRQIGTTSLTHRRPDVRASG